MAQAAQHDPAIPGESGRERVIRPPGAQKTLEWITALAAAGIDYRLSRQGGAWSIHVRAAQWDEVREEIRAYEVTNRGWPPAPPAERDPARAEGPGWSSLGAVVLLCLCYAALGPYTPLNPLLRAAAADSAQIREGEWWRPVTALLVHADGLHMAGNALLLFFLGRAIVGIVGSGIGWLVILAAGAAGNAAVARGTAEAHVSVGASTSVFGALGLLAACRFLEQARHPSGLRSVWSRAWLPLLAATALLGLLGTGPRSDLAAHALGFVCGTGFALPAWALSRRAVARRLQPVLLAAALAAIAAAWRGAVASLAVGGGPPLSP